MTSNFVNRAKGEALASIINDMLINDNTQRLYNDAKAEYGEGHPITEAHAAEVAKGGVYGRISELCKALAENNVPAIKQNPTAVAAINGVSMVHMANWRNATAKKLLMEQKTLTKADLAKATGVKDSGCDKLTRKLQDDLGDKVEVKGDTISYNG